MSVRNNIRTCWSRSWSVIVFCVTLFLFVLPMHAQDKEAEDIKKKNETLKQQIKDLTEETTKLESLSAKNNKQMALMRDSLQTLKARNNAQQIDVLQAQVDSLERDNKALKEQYEKLCKEEASKQKELSGLSVDIRGMDTYAKVERKQKYEQSQALFSQRYSDLDLKQVNDLVAHLTDYKDMDGYADYEKHVQFMQQNKTLYDECLTALSGKYDPVKVQELRDRLQPLRENKENKAKGIYKLTSAQFNELDSIDISLSRFQGGLNELQNLMKKVNDDAEISRLRKEGKDRTAIVAAIGKYVDKEATTKKKDWKNQSMVERYFNMVPYLDKAYKAYKSELSDKPFKTTKIEKEILAYEL